MCIKSEALAPLTHDAASRDCMVPDEFNPAQLLDTGSVWRATSDQSSRTVTPCKALPMLQARLGSGSDIACTRHLIVALPVNVL
jgi:hypothetical protein